MSHRASVAVLVFLLFAFPTGVASEQAPSPVAVDRVHEGAGWVAFRFVDESGMFNFSIERVGEEGTLRTTALIRGDGFSLGAGSESFSSDWAGVQVDALGAPVLELRSGLESHHGGEGAIRYEYRCGVCDERPEVRTREFVGLVMVGGDAEWRLRLDSPDGRLVGVTEGDRIWYLTGHDFQSPARVRAIHGSGGAHVEAGSFYLEAQDSLVGFFHRSLSSQAEMRVQAFGGTIDCPCMFDADPWFFLNWNSADAHVPGLPGRYEFSFVDAGASGFMAVELFVADVRFPAPEA